MPPTTRLRLPSIRSQIALLVLACALPALIAFGAVVREFYLRERSALIEDSRQRSHNIALALDAELLQLQYQAALLDLAPGTQPQALDTWRSQASALLGGHIGASQILLSDLQGQPLRHTGARLPDALSAQRNPARLQALWARRQATLARLDARPDSPLALDLPVILGGQLRYALTLLLPPAPLGQVLAAARRAPQQSVVLYDARGQALVSANAPDPVLPAALPPGWAAQLAHSASTVQLGRDPDDIGMHLAASRAPRSGLIVAIRTPHSLAAQQLMQAILPIAVLMGALLLGGLVLAWRVGGRIARSVRGLLPAASDRGAPIAPSFREAQQVGAAFSALHADLRHHRRQLETLVAERTSQLERSRAQLDTLYATAPVGLSYVDSALRIVRINDFLAALNDRSVTEHLGRHVGELIADPEVRRDVLHDYRTVLETGQALTGIERSGYTAASPQALCHWVVSYYPQFGADGKLSAITSLLLDITPQKRVETELHASKQLLKSVVENMPAMIFLKRASDLRYELFNRYGAQLLGIPAEQIVGRSDDELISDEQAATFRTIDLQVLESDQVLEIADEPLTSADGVLHHLTTRKVALRDDQGRATHVLGMSLDITERKQAEQVLQATTARLAQSEHFVRAVTDNLPGMVAYWDATLRCRFANRYFLEWHQQDAQQIHGALMPDVMGADAFAASAPYVDAALRGQPQGFAGQLAWPSGDLSYTWTNYIPDLDPHAVVRGFFVLVSDVTELKETEFHLQQLNDELVQARDRAEAASRAKSAFLANMSHEIRTPMNAIIGLTRLLEEAPLAERERSQLGKIQLATQSLLGVVNDVLDFSRIEAGQLQLEQTRFQLDHLLSSTSVLLAGSAWDKGVEPVYDISPEIPLELLGDPMRLQQVLLNLMSNAIKFTARGEVVLSVRPLPSAAADDARLTLEFSVRDTGIGIPAEQAQQVFEAFTQADSSTSRKFGGTGLGLAICRRLSELMGGSITLDSTPGHGAHFRVTCPLLRSDSVAGRQLPRPQDSALQGLSLLIIDDNPSVCQALQRAGLAFGWQVDLAHDAQQALQRARSGSYDLLLLDYALCGLDGGELLAQLASAADHALAPVLLMLPEHASGALAEQVQRLGAAGLLPKPISAVRLLERVTQLRLHPGPASTEAASTSLSGRLQGLRLLLVEDNEINQEVAQYLLVHAGANVDLAHHGQQAVDLLRLHPTRYDAILMDVQMPVLNGYDATFQIRAMGLRDLPIIAMTANVMDEDRRRATEAGMDAHVAKPIDVDDLIGTLKRLVRRAPSPASPAPGAARRPTSASATAHAPLPGIALEAALQRLDGSYPMLISLLQRFEHAHGHSVADLRTLLQAGQDGPARQLLHRLRGIAGNLGALTVAQQCALLEQALQDDHAERPPLAPLLDSLDAAIAVVAAGSRTLASQANTASAPQHAHNWQLELAELQTLLQNHNLKALTSFHELRPMLAAAAAAPTLALATAVENLDFATAQRIVTELLQRKESA